MSATPFGKNIGHHQFVGIVVEKKRKICRIQWSGPMAGVTDNYWHAEDSLQIISKVKCFFKE